MKEFYDPVKIRADLAARARLYDERNSGVRQARLKEWAMKKLGWEGPVAKVYWHDLPDFVKQRARDKGISVWMITKEGAL